MTATKSCPTPAAMQHFLLGQIPELEAERIERHLADCPACLDSVRSLKVSDTLLDAMQDQAGAAELTEPKAVEDLIAKLQALRSSETSAGDTAGSATLPPHGGGVSGDSGTRDQYDFLSPPQATGELGRLGPYRVLKLLGAGGMGVVFQAEDPQLKRLVALKAMKPALAASDSAKKRFLREAQATAAIENDHIVTIHQVGEDRGVPFIAMQYLQGETLEDRLQRHPQPPIAEILRIGREIAEGLAAAHDRGLMHRDIKPANVWLEQRSRHAPRDESNLTDRRDASKPGNVPNDVRSKNRLPHAEREGYSRVKILDFGLARAAAGNSANLTQYGEIIGTPAYMAPEQAKNEKVDSRCDLFSLGCILYRMTTGKIPFKGSTALDTLLAVIQHDPTPPHKINSQVPEGVGRLVMRLLEKDPAKRLPTAHKVIEIITAIEQKLAEPTRSPSIATHRVAGVEPRGTSGEPPAVTRPIAKKSSASEKIPAGGSKTRPQPPAQAKPRDVAAVPWTNDADEADAAPALHRVRPTPTKRLLATRRNWLLASAIVAVLATGGLFAPQVIRIATGQGTLEIQLDDPSIEVKIKDGAIKLVDAAGKQEYELSIKPGRQNVKAGEYRVAVANDAGLVVNTDEFKLTAGGTVRVRVRAEAPRLAASNAITPPVSPTQLAPAADSSPSTPAVKQSSPAVNAATTTDEWTDLLAPVDPAKHSPGKIRWQRDGTKLVGSRQVPAGKRDWLSIILGQQIAGDFDFEIDLLAVTVVPVFVDLPVQDTIVSVAFDPRPGESGLNNIDGKLQKAAGVTVPLGVMHSLKVSVRNSGDQAQVDATLDGKPFSSFSGPRSRLTFPPDWAAPARNKIKIAGYVNDASSRIVLHRAQIKQVNAVAASDPGPAPDDLARWQGKWRCVAENAQGRDTSPEELAARNHTMRIDGTRRTVERTINGKVQPYSGTIRINSAASPHEFDFDFDDSKLTGGQCGLYEFDGPRLRLIYRTSNSGKPARAKWSDKGQPNVVWFEFERGGPAGIGAPSTKVDRPTTPAMPSVPAKATTQTASVQQSLAAVQKRRQEIDADRYRPGSVRSIDEVELRDGRKFVGKLIEYGTHFIIVSNQGRQAFPRKDVSRAEAKKRPDEMNRPDLPDLDVTHIERTPRTRSNHNNVDYPDGLPKLKQPNPEPLFPTDGTEVTFTAHVLNKGTRDSGAATYQWLIDGKPAGDGKLGSVAARAEATATLKWRWQSGPHSVAFVVEPPAGTREVSTRNNRLTDRTDALGFLIHVTKESYDEYNRMPNMIDTFSFEDWVQFHFEVWNFLFEESIYPDAPAGCLARARVDKILYVNEATLDQQVTAAQRDGHPDGYYFQGTWQFGRWDEYGQRLAHMDWGFIHEMGHQLGLIDEYRLFADVEQIRVKHNGEFVNLTHQYSQADSMMSHHGPFVFSDQATLALNRQLTRHRGYFGDYQFPNPDRNVLRILNRAGQPIAGVKLTFYQRRSGQAFTNEPVGAGTTDGKGELVMPNQAAPDYTTPDGLFRLTPNPFGKMDVLGDAGLLLVKLEFGEWTEWHWLENTPFNAAALAGRKEFTQEIKTHLPSASAPAAPRNLRAAFVTADEVNVTFDPVAGAKSYRLYSKKNREGWNFAQFTLVQTLTEPKRAGLKIGDKAMYLAVTAVDAAGTESGPSNLAYCRSLAGTTRIAIAPDGTRYISDAHPHIGRVIRQRPDRTIDDWEVRPAPDTRGRFIGLALAPSGNLLAANNYSHRVHIFTPTGEELKSAGGQGAGNGQFNLPHGICVDRDNNVYVADSGNHRIQVLELNLNWRSNIPGSFKDPQDVWSAGGRLYVADTGNQRIVVLEKSGDNWRVAQTFGGFQAPVDVTTNRTGQVIVADHGSGSVIVLDAAGKRQKTFDKLGDVSGVAVTADDTIVAPSDFNRIHELKL